MRISLPHPSTLTSPLPSHLRSSPPTRFKTATNNTTTQQAADSELLEESGSRRKWRLDYTARWNFWKVSGVCENRCVDLCV